MDEVIATTLLGKWDQRFQGLACHISEWSKDPSTKCGAVIISPARIIVGMGFNGFPRGVRDEEELLQNREIKYNRTVHADVNAVLFANQSIEGCTIYTWPFMPCSRCATVLIQKGISRVVSPTGSPNNWKSSVEEALRLFSESGTKVILTRARL